MSTKEKLIERFKRIPSDFTFDELISIMGHYGFSLLNKGATSGSRVAFKKGELSVIMHKPHPGKIVGKKTLRSIIDFFTKNAIWEN